MTFGDNLAFQSCNDKEFLTWTSDANISPIDPNSDPIVPSELQHNEDEGEILDTCNCKYFSVSEYHELSKEGNFDIFHNNINGLENKLGNLNQFLTTVSPKFDIVALTETSEKHRNEGFLSNIEMNGYKIFSTPSKSNKGGVTLCQIIIKFCHRKICIATFQ